VGGRFDDGAVSDKPKSHTCHILVTYSALFFDGNCEFGAGRCSAASAASRAPRKIGMRISLILRHSDFAGMEKVRENALISLFLASFYCGKEAKTLCENKFSSGIPGMGMIF
jgi:hypothetical protein